MREPVFSFGIARVALGAAMAVALSCAGCNANTSRGNDERAPAVTPGTVSVAVRPTVTWPASEKIDDRALVSLSDTASGERSVRASIARSPVPVLAPRDLRLASPTLVVEGEYFALTGRFEGATISLQGTRQAHRYDGIDPVTGNREIVRGGAPLRAFLSVNEGIRTASWMEGGAAYSIDVECADPREARCQSDDFLLSIVAQLAYVGGSGR